MSEEYDSLGIDWGVDEQKEERSVCYWCGKAKDGGSVEDIEVLDIQPCPECNKKWEERKKRGIILFEYTTDKYSLCNFGYTRDQCERIEELCAEDGLGECILTGSSATVPDEMFDDKIAPALDEDMREKAKNVRMMFMEDKIFTEFFRKEEPKDENTEGST